MIELLEQILNNLDFLQRTNISSNIDAVSSVTEPESEVLATSPSKDNNAAPERKKPESDSEICKRLTDHVSKLRKNSKLVPLATAEEIDTKDRKHMVFSGGLELPILGDRVFTGCFSFPAPSPAPYKK